MRPTRGVRRALHPIEPGSLIISAKSFDNGSGPFCLVSFLYIEATATKCSELRISIAIRGNSVLCETVPHASGGSIPNHLLAS